MKRKIVVLASFVVLAAVAGGLFYFWQNQKDVRALNKTLPKDIFVTKSLWSNEYKVVNKIDNYEFKVPKVWNGLEKIEYIASREKQGFKGTSVFTIGKTGTSRTMSVDAFEKKGGKTLKQWAQSFFDVFGLTGEFQEENLGNFFILRTIEEKHLGGANIFFIETDFKNYVFTGGSEESIKEIILNGKW
jgi:hypothetical protein